MQVKQYSIGLQMMPVAVAKLELQKWWLFLKTVGSKFGYFPKATNCWLIVKPDKFEEAKSAFDGIDINVTCEGSRSYLEEYVGSKVEAWV